VRRATYYLRPDQIRGLKMCAVLEQRHLSDIMRDAVDRYLRECAGGAIERLLSDHGSPARTVGPASLS
jgi:hypothetical protein